MSIDVILAGQSPSGAIIASPTFPTYHYSWLRDGSFIAYALDRVGRHEAAARFHRWVAEAVLRHQDRAQAAISRARRGLPPAEGAYLHCRYTLDGEEGGEGWPNFQLDGYGTWLWALEQHLLLTGGAPVDGTVRLAEMPREREAAIVATGYIRELWGFPTYDCWEENGDRLHPATLACLYGGLDAASRLLEDGAAASAAARVRERVLTDAARLGRLAKHLGGDGIDASLLWCSTPFRLVEPGDPLMQATVREIERRCVDPSGGVHRYPEDTYYGGGAWLLLTAWLGWYHCEVGRVEEARACLAWVEARADAAGQMPEQVAEHLHDPAFLPEWEQRWGKSASPLLWSHAMHLVLQAELRKYADR
ncbi:MAG: glycoside hydrolase family 15 protein [Symbiobacteriia bacterium]